MVQITLESSLTGKFAKKWGPSLSDCLEIHASFQNGVANKGMWRSAEARLAARRQYRAEAREIRMREIERLQKESDQNDVEYELEEALSHEASPLAQAKELRNSSTVNGITSECPISESSENSSRRSSNNSTDDDALPQCNRGKTKNSEGIEERYRKIMIINAQLENEKASQSYEIQLLKDKLEEMEEIYEQLQREFKNKSHESIELKLNRDRLMEELKLVRGQLEERDKLITEQGLCIVTIENQDATDARRSLVTVENAQLLGSVRGSLDVRLKRFGDEKRHLQNEIESLREQVDHLRSERSVSTVDSDEEYEIQRETNKIVHDYENKLQKCEKEIFSLQSNITRIETQLIRYKAEAEEAVNTETDLKAERRRLQKENREALERIEELEASNNHLLKRFEKLKTAKSALLKEL